MLRSDAEKMLRMLCKDESSALNRLEVILNKNMPEKAVSVVGDSFGISIDMMFGMTGDEDAKKRMTEILKAFRVVGASDSDITFVMKGE